jgi:hypothetical protein
MLFENVYSLKSIVDGNRDMRDKISHSHALEDRFSWSVVPMPTPSERKNFEMACEKWDKWEMEHAAAQEEHSSRRASQYSPSVQTTSSEGSGHGQKEKKPRYVPAARRLSRALRVFVAWKA